MGGCSCMHARVRTGLIIIERLHVTSSTDQIPEI